MGMTTLFARGPSEGQGWPQKRRIFALTASFTKKLAAARIFNKHPRLCEFFPTPFPSPKSFVLPRRRLSFPKIISGRIDGVRSGLGLPRSHRTVGSFAAMAHPSGMSDVAAFHLIGCISREHAAQMAFTDDKDVVQALAARRANQRFGYAILPGMNQG
jgi:hypothetical protein